MTIKIVTDTGADLPADLAIKHNISVVPVNVMFGDDVYKDGISITKEEFNNKMFVEGLIPKTSQPSPSDFLTVYKDITDNGDSVLSIHLSSKLSGTYNSALQAAESMDLGTGQKIQIVDSLKASIPIALGVLATAEHLQNNPNISIGELAQYADDALKRSTVYVALNTLEYLQRGGRIGKASALLGTMLRIKPILSLEGGEVVPVAKCRSLSQSLAQISDLIASQGELSSAALIYNTDLETKDSLKAQLLAGHPGLNLIETEFGPSIGSYVGPNAIGVATIPKGS